MIAPNFMNILQKFSCKSVKNSLSYSSAKFHRPMFDCDVTVVQLMTTGTPNLEIGHFRQPVSAKPVLRAQFFESPLNFRPKLGKGINHPFMNRFG